MLPEPFQATHSAVDCRMAVAVATGQEAGHKPVEVPTELIISHLIPQLSPDGLLALSQTSRYFRACAKSAPPHAAGVPPLHPYHQAGAQLLKVSNKWTCIHYAIARQESARGRLMPCRPDLASAYSPDAGKHVACFRRTGRLIGAANSLLILNSRLGAVHFCFKLSPLAYKGSPPALGRGEQCLWSPTARHLLATLVGGRCGGAVLCVDLSAPHTPAVLQVAPQQSWTRHDDLFQARAWSPDSRLIAVALAKPHPGSAQVLVLNPALETVHMAYCRAVALAWGPSSQHLAALHREMYVHTELRQLAVLGPFRGPPCREALSAGRALALGASSCVGHAEFSQGGAFLALAQDALLVAWPDWPCAAELRLQHALQAAWVPGAAGPEQLLLHAREPKGFFQLRLYQALPGTLTPAHALGLPVFVLPQCLAQYCPCVALHPSGLFVALASHQHAWVVCRVATGEICQRGRAVRDVVLSAVHWSGWGETLWLTWSNSQLSAVRFGLPELDLSALGCCLARAKAPLS